MSERDRLLKAISALEAQRTILGDAVVDTAVDPLRQKLATLERPALDEQRKQVTLLFADVSGFTAMSETLDAEDVSQIMNALWQQLDRVITEHGGHIDKHMGDAVMAIWGIETAREDDPEQAIRAALAMQLKVENWNKLEMGDWREAFQLLDPSFQPPIPNLQIRIGINTGLVHLGKVGTAGEYSAIGDAVNLASRLEHAAPVGGVLISHDSYRHVRGIFNVQPLEPIQVKGKKEPIKVYVVQQAKPRAFHMATRGVEGIETRTIGREAELLHLQRAFHTAIEDGQRQMVTVTGEAGLGKSRLLYEFYNWIDLLPPPHVYIFEGRATQNLQAQPYALIRDLFAFRFQIQDSDPVEVVREKMEQGIGEAFEDNGVQVVRPQSVRPHTDAQMRAHFIGQLLGFDFSTSPHLRGVLDDAKQLYDRALIYISDYFKAMTGRLPVVISLEDLHWADASSLDLLNHLAMATPQQRLLIICLARPALFERRPHWGEGQAFHTCLDLAPLSNRDSRRLVEEILQKLDQVPEALRELVVGKAEGNPYYLEELVKMLIEDGVIIKETERWWIRPTRLITICVPPTLTGVLQARIDRLSQKERAVLQRAAVVGRIFWDDTVAFLGGRDLGEREQESVPPTDLASLYEAGLRQLLNRIGPDHARYSEALVYQQRLVESITQSRRYGDSDTRKVERSEIVDRLNELALAALRISFNELCGQAPPIQGTSPAEHPREQDLAPTAKALAALHQRELIFRRETTTFAGTTEYIFRHAILYDVTYESVLKRMRRPYHALVAEWLIEHSGERAGEHTGQIADHLELAGKTEQAASYLTRAGEQAAAQFANAEAVAYYSHALDLTPETDTTARYALLRARERVYDLQGERSAQGEDLQEMARLAEELADPKKRIEVLNRQALRASAVGVFKEGQAIAREALDIAHEVGDRLGEAEAYKIWGILQASLGENQEAGESFQRALETYRLLGHREGEFTSLCNLGLLSHYQGNLEGALQFHRQALEITPQLDNPRRKGILLDNLGLTYRRQEDYDRARRHSEQALVILREIGDLPGVGIALGNIGAVAMAQGDLEAARSCYQQALDLSRQLQNRELEATSLCSLGLLHRYLGESEPAREYLRAALRQFRQISHRRGEADTLHNLGVLQLQAGWAQPAEEVLQRALALWQEIGDASNALVTQAWLGLACLDTGEQSRARACLEKVLAQLEDEGYGGAYPEQEVWWAAYQVWQACGERKRAQQALEQAYRLVQEQAGRIHDLAMKQSFLERVSVNREVVRAWDTALP